MPESKSCVDADRAPGWGVGGNSVSLGKEERSLRRRMVSLPLAWSCFSVNWVDCQPPHEAALKSQQVWTTVTRKPKGSLAWGRAWFSFTPHVEISLL